jgi:hypothetical protein
MTYIIAFISVIVAFSRSSFIDFLIPPSLYYGWFIFVAFLNLLSLKKKNKFNKGMVLFLITCIISILLNDIDPFFQPWQRFLSFTIFIISIGPFIENAKQIEFRNIVLKITNTSIVVITIISFLGYSMNNSFSFSASGFSGLTNQSMLLSPIAAISTLITLNQFFEENRTLKKYVFLLLSVISLLTCLLAASRGAIGALAVSLLSYFYLCYRKNLGKLIKLILLVLFLTSISYPLWEPYTINIVAKQEHRTETDNLLSNRDQMWIDRIKDFQHSPIYGVGFSSMHYVKNSKTNKVTGLFEPGSTWLFILSSLGLMGFIIFSILMFKPLWKTLLINQKINTQLSVEFSILIFFSIHFFIEGYALSSGTFLFFYLWLTIAVTQERSLYSRYITLNR